MTVRNALIARRGALADVAIADCLTVSMQAMLAHDPSIAAVAKLPPGWMAWRAGRFAPSQRGMQIPARNTDTWLIPTDQPGADEVAQELAALRRLADRLFAADSRIRVALRIEDGDDLYLDIFRPSAGDRDAALPHITRKAEIFVVSAPDAELFGVLLFDCTGLPESQESADSAALPILRADGVERVVLAHCRANEHG